MVAFENQPELRSHVEMVLARCASLAKPLKAFADELPWGRQRSELRSVVELLEQGDAAAAAASFAKLPDHWLPLLSAASVCPDPQRVLRRFLEESRQAEELRRQRWQAFAYPLAIVGMAAAVFTMLSILVIPVFSRMFAEFEIKIPSGTRMLLNAAAGVTSGALPLAIAVGVGLVWLVGRVLRHGMSPNLRDAAARWIPSPFGRATDVARFTQFTADLLEANLAVALAVRVAGHCSRDAWIRLAAAELARDLERTEVPHIACGEAALTHTAVFALGSPLTGPTRVRLLRELSTSYTQRARKRLSWTRGICEPLAIVAVGAVVGWTVLVLFMPLVSLVSALS